MITNGLQQAYVEKKTPLPLLSASLATVLGVDFRRTGWPSELPNKTSCYDLPSEYATSTAYLLDADVPTEIAPGYRLCFRAGSYHVAVPDKRVELKLDFDQSTSAAMPKIFATVLDRRSEINGNQITLPTGMLCPDQWSEENPLTLPVPSRDDVIITAPRLFSTVASVRLAVEDKANLCDRDCMGAFHRTLIEAILAWKSGCTRCTFANLLLIKDGETTYFDSRTVTMLIGYLSSHRPLPDPNQKPASANTGLFSGYQELDRGSAAMATLCSATFAKPYDQLCRDSQPETSLKLTVQISDSGDACGPETAIACADPSGVIQLRAHDHIFSISSTQSVPRIEFGRKGRTFDLMTVLVHELGHFFGVPHVKQAQSTGREKTDVMLETYSVVGSCITKADLNMLNNAVDPSWPFRLIGCAGLHYY
jgi:hypothetical protein